MLESYMREDFFGMCLITQASQIVVVTVIFCPHGVRLKTRLASSILNVATSDRQILPNRWCNKMPVFIKMAADISLEITRIKGNMILFLKKWLPDPSLHRVSNHCSRYESQIVQGYAQEIWEDGEIKHHGQMMGITNPTEPPTTSFLIGWYRS